MITFLVSLFLFHVYNFVINKDNLSGKITEKESSNFNDTNELIKTAEKLIAQTLVKIQGIIGSLKQDKKYIPDKTSQSINYDNIISFLEKSEKKMDKDDLSCRELKNSLITQNKNMSELRLGKFNLILIKYILSGALFLLMILYFLWESKEWCHYFEKFTIIFSEKICSFSAALEILFYICIIGIICDITILIIHHKKFKNSFFNISNKITDLMDQVKKEQDEIDNKNSMEIVILKKEIQGTIKGKEAQKIEDDDEIPF